MLHTYIGVAVAVAIFMFFFFGSRIFPQIFVFDLFQAGVFSAQQAAQQQNLGGGSSDVSVFGDVSAGGLDFDASTLSSILADLPDPVSVIDIEEGTGAEAIESSAVSVGYRGTYIDQTTGEEVLFDENTNRNAPFTFVLGSGQVIPGFEIGVAGMREGGIRFVIIKPEMGYGDRQAGSIPPNTTLRFVIELYEVR